MLREVQRKFFVDNDFATCSTAVNFQKCTPLDCKRDRKHSLKFREMLETQGYKQAQDAEERRQREA